MLLNKNPTITKWNSYLLHWHLEERRRRVWKAGEWLTIVPFALCRVERGGGGRQSVKSVRQIKSGLRLLHTSVTVHKYPHSVIWLFCSVHSLASHSLGTMAVRFDWIWTCICMRITWISMVFLGFVQMYIIFSILKYKN